MRPFRVVVWTVAGGAALATVFLLGRASVRRETARPAPPAASETSARPHDPRAETLRTLARSLRALPVSGGSGGDAGEDPALMEAKVRHAHALLGQVFEKLEALERSGPQQAEARAAAVVPYLEGVLRGATEADPATRAAFSQEFTSQLCERELPDDQATTLAHMAMIFPDVPTTRGIDCFFARAKEGVPFWTMLDAWRRSGLERTPILERIRTTATDPRTTRRFLSSEEVYAQELSGSATPAPASTPVPR